jgi:RNA polymerase sigma factor (sigma-70 family)
VEPTGRLVVWGGTVAFQLTMEPEDKEEARFIARLASRDERAFNELVVLYQERVFRILLRMLGRRDEAEDMAQEVFVQVFKAVGTFRGDSKLSTWIYRIAVNLCKNRVKYLKRRRTEAQDEYEAMAERSDGRRHAARARRPAVHRRARPRLSRGADPA